MILALIPHILNFTVKQQINNNSPNCLFSPCLSQSILAKIYMLSEVDSNPIRVQRKTEQGIQAPEAFPALVLSVEGLAGRETGIL